MKFTIKYFFLMLLFLTLLNINFASTTNAQNSNGYQLGDREQGVIELKENLNQLGFSGILVTDFFGDFTKRKVEEFQKYYGLKVDGKANGETLSKIDEILSSDFQQGKRHKDTETIKRKLNAIGYGPIIVSPLYGSYMSDQVRDFQRDNGLAVSGIFDEVSLEKLNQLYNPPYRKGDRHTDISQMKRSLNRLGFNGIIVSDYYGSFTEEKVKEFQRQFGLSVDGIAGNNTLSKIDEVISSPFQQGKRHEETKKIKRQLNAIGYGPIQVTTLYGEYMSDQVRAFQRDNGLAESGIMDEVSLEKLAASNRPPFQKGDYHNEIAKMKRSLNKIGFDGIIVTNYYGSYTEEKVKEFQRQFGLSVNGVANESTLAKLNEILSSPLQEGNRHDEVISIKQQLNALGYGPIQVTSLYGSYMKSQIMEFQKANNLAVSGIADEVTVAKINSAATIPFRRGDRHEIILQMKKDLNRLGYGRIIESNYFGSYAEQQLKKFQANNGLNANGVLNQATLDKLSSFFIKTNYPIEFSSFVDSLMTMTPKADGQGLVRAGRNLVEYYANPSTFDSNSNGYLQYLLLTESANIDVNEINRKVLNSNAGTLRNTAKDFARAGRDFGLNEIYLIAHALHETGNGNSTLARGVPVDRNGNVTRNSRDQIANTSSTVATVYNMYGVAASDGVALEAGARHAYNQEWFTPAEAVYGGAEFIANRFVNRGQDTLYKMKWNPDGTGPGHYATHVSWAIIQTNRMANIFSEIDTFTHRFEVPSFRNQPARTRTTPPENFIDYPKNVVGVTTANVNFRSGPSTSNTTIYTTLSRGEQMEVRGTNGRGWYQVKVGNREGWISASLVELQNLFEVTATTLNVRPSANTSNTPVGQLRRSQYVSGVLTSNGNLRRSGEWYNIYYNNSTYWVSSGNNGQLLKQVK